MQLYYMCCMIPAVKCVKDVQKLENKNKINIEHLSVTCKLLNAEIYNTRNMDPSIYMQRSNGQI